MRYDDRPVQHVKIDNEYARWLDNAAGVLRPFDGGDFLAVIGYAIGILAVIGGGIWLLAP